MDMAIKAKELLEFRPVIRTPDSDEITLSRYARALTEAAQKYDLPLHIEENEVSYGLLSDRVPCLTLSHPDHFYDYLKFCLQIRLQGSFALVSVHLFGNSRQLKKDAISHTPTGAGAALLFGGVAGAGFALGVGLRRMANAIGKSRSKLEMEQLWYAQVSEILDQVVC